MGLKTMKTSDNVALDVHVTGAINSYFYRIITKLMLTPTNVIVDSLSETCEYIASIVSFVANLAADDKTTCPFQFDAVLAFNHVKENSNKLKYGDNDDEKENDALRQARMFNNGFKQFKKEKIKSKYKGKELKEYPRRHRFC